MLPWVYRYRLRQHWSICWCVPVTLTCRTVRHNLFDVSIDSRPEKSISCSLFAFCFTKVTFMDVVKYFRPEFLGNNDPVYFEEDPICYSDFVTVVPVFSAQSVLLDWVSDQLSLTVFLSASNSRSLSVSFLISSILLSLTGNW